MYKEDSCLGYHRELGGNSTLISFPWHLKSFTRWRSSFLFHMCSSFRVLTECSFSLYAFKFCILCQEQTVETQLFIAILSFLTWHMSLNTRTCTLTRTFWLVRELLKKFNNTRTEITLINIWYVARPMDFLRLWQVEVWNYSVIGHWVSFLPHARD